MEKNNYNMNNTIIIIFYGFIKDIYRNNPPLEWNILSNPNEKLENLISKFFQISGLDPNYYRLYFNGQNIENYKSSTLAQLGLINFSRIEISYVELGNYNRMISNNGIFYNHNINFNKNIYSNSNAILNNMNNNINNGYNLFNNGNRFCIKENSEPKIILPREERNFGFRPNFFQNFQKVDESCKFNYNPLNYEIYIKFIKFSDYSAFNCYKDLKGILKLCLLNEIASKIDDSYLNNLFEKKNIPENLFYIMKILKKSYVYVNQKNEVGNAIEKILRNNNGCNVLNFSNYVEEQINQEWIQKINNFVPPKDLNDINDTKFRLGKYVKYMAFFEKEIYNSLKLSIFEFSPISLVVLDREDFDRFEKEKEKCPNRCEEILYHGTQTHPISLILTGMFHKSVDRHYQHGKGVYFTDSLDNCWFYGGSENNRQNMNKIPPIGDTFTAICSMVYYDIKGFLKVNDHKTRLQPGKNEINFAYAGCHFETIPNPDFTKFVGTEYCVFDLDQICPIISVKFKREEYCVIWRDDNFSRKDFYKNEFDEKFKIFLKDRISYIKQTAKYNVYQFETSTRALKCVNRKKYNKIILISNVGPDLRGRAFVDEARKIIGNDVIVLFLAYNIQHLNWIKNYKNAIFSNEPKFYEEYLDNFSDEQKMKSLIAKLENHYKVKFNFDDKFLHFPLFKDKGQYSELKFQKI